MNYLEPWVCAFFGLCPICERSPPGQLRHSSSQRGSSGRPSQRSRAPCRCPHSSGPAEHKLSWEKVSEKKKERWRDREIRVNTSLNETITSFQIRVWHSARMPCGGTHVRPSSRQSKPIGLRTVREASANLILLIPALRTSGDPGISLWFYPDKSLFSMYRTLPQSV